MQSTFTPSRSSELEALVRIEARVVEKRRRPAQPRRHERVAGGQRPAAGGGAPAEVARACPVPVLRLDALAGQVAVPVADRLRLARGPGGEHDQRGVLRGELHRARRGGVEERLVGHRQHRPVEAGARHQLEVASVGHQRPRARPCRCGRAGPPGAAARCRAGPRRRSASRRASRRPTPGRFPTTVITTSPRPTPRAASAPARRAERSATSPKEISRRSPSGPTATSASRDGSAASTTSATKLIQVATSARRG